MPTNEPQSEHRAEAEKARRGDTMPQRQRQAREHRQISAEVVHASIRYEGEEELDRPAAALFWSGLAAGLTMGLSMLGMGVLQHALPDTAWRHLVSSLGYTVGFVFVVAARQQLFTENTLTPVLPLLHRRRSVVSVARLWGIVLIANLIGAAIFALVAARTTLFEPALRTTFTEMGQQLIAPSAGTVFVRAIAAGWLIALMVWLLPAAESSRFLAIVLPTYLIAAAHFAHSIAGAVEVFFLVASGAGTMTDSLVFLGLALSGNIIGGVTLVAALNHAQVVAGDEEE